MEYSKIFLSLTSYIDLQVKSLINKILMRKKNTIKIKIITLINQAFILKIIFETNKKTNIHKKKLFSKQNLFIIFYFFSLILIFGIRILHVSLNQIERYRIKKLVKKTRHFKKRYS